MSQDFTLLIMSFLIPLFSNIYNVLLSLLSFSNYLLLSKERNFAHSACT